MTKCVINTDNKKSVISPHIYGHFSEHLGRCIYGGVFVGENSPIPNTGGMRNDVVAALREMGLPVLRWPGGCFADEYHWKDGIGDPSGRKRMVNTHWGGVVEDNSFGTHEFFELCRQVGCEAYVNGNVGSGEVAEISEWVEYMTSNGQSPMASLRRENGRDEPWRLPFFGVGNENWGCGGNMRPEYYSDLYRRYATYVRNYGGGKIFKIACGPGTGYGAGELKLEWTETLMKNAAGHMDGLSLHYYTVPGGRGKRGSATDFDEAEYYATLKKALWIGEVIRRHDALMERYDSERRVKIIFDEWGTWFDAEPGTNPGFLYQQSTMRDALVAGLTLNIFNSRADIVHMANIAQLVNVLQAVILTEGASMLLTPTYHVFRMYKAHQGARLLESSLVCGGAGPEAWRVPAVSHSASEAADGSVLLTLCNLSASEPCEMELTVAGRHVKPVCGEVLTGAIGAHNTFGGPENVRPEPFDGARAVEHNKSGTQAALSLPPCSVISVRWE